MINPDNLDPKQVLAHLNAMGYCDITPQQLKEFIHDLRKLIKYEQKIRASQPCEEVGFTDTQLCEEVGYTDTLLCEEVKSTGTQPRECDCYDPEFSESLHKCLNESYESSIDSPSTSATYSAGNNKQSSRNHAESEYTQKYHTSFIRSWNLQGCKDLSGRVRRNFDPVRLYHQYKEFWKRQNIPGENKHLELRWDIRNRMVGQEPSPRVCI